MCQETASHFPAETYGFGVHNWWLKVCEANFFRGGNKVENKAEIIKVDGLGRVKIPKFIRDQLAIKPKDYFKIIVRDGDIILIPTKSSIYEPTAMGWEHS